VTQNVCIQGLGFVGSAMAVAVASARDASGCPLYNVTGVDLPTTLGRSRVEALNAGTFPFRTSDEKLLAAVNEAARQGNLRATTDAEAYAHADIIVVNVHLDISFREDQPQLEMAGFIEAMRQVGRRMREDALVIIETTVPPGTSLKLAVPALRDELAQRGLDPDRLLLAHSPERVMPGKDYLDSILNYWRVYAGHTPEAADACEAFLASFINVKDYPLTRLSSTTASETSKVLENSYRAVNIAFIHEWTRYAEVVGIDLFEVIAAVQKRPTHSNMRYPGLGIGGYCLTKDPAFAPAATRQLFGRDIEFPFSRLAISTAADMPSHTIERLTRLLDGAVAGKRILLCGICYREDVADTRYSPSEIVYRELVAQGAQVDVHDPFVSYWQEVQRPVANDLPSPEGYAAVLFATPHAVYKRLDLPRWMSGSRGTAVLDAFMVFSSRQRQLFREAGMWIESIGVGDGL